MQFSGKMIYTAPAADIKIALRIAIPFVLGAAGILLAYPSFNHYFFTYPAGFVRQQGSEEKNSVVMKKKDTNP